MTAEKLLSHYSENLFSYLKFLKELVEINSFTQNPSGIAEVNRITAQQFQSLGFSSREVPSAIPNFGRHQILSRGGDSPYTIAMISHADTVYPPEEEERNNFRWSEEGDKIFGPGTIDIKGGTAMIYAVLEGLSIHYPALFQRINWEIFIDASEEDDNRDFGQLVRESLDRENTLAVLVFEPGKFDGKQFKIVTARKGMAVFKITAEGRSAHAGTAHPKGVNAVVQLAEIVPKLAELTDYSRELTVNPGPFRGGTVTNRVPDFAELLLEMRAFEPDVFSEAFGKITSFQGYSTVKSPADGFGAKVEVQVLRQTKPWPRNPRTEKLFSIWEGAAKSLQLTAIPEERGGLSDANLLWEEFPTIDGLGPSGANAHCSQRTPDGSKEPEYLWVPSFVPKAALNTLAIAELVEELGL